MLMKPVINSSLCCRFFSCLCNQMWSFVGFTAINELRGVARGGRAAAGLGWAELGSGSPRTGPRAAASSPAGVASSGWWWSWTLPRPPERRKRLPAVSFSGGLTFGGSGWGGVNMDLYFYPLTSPPITPLKQLAAAPIRGAFIGGG